MALLLTVEATSIALTTVSTTHKDLNFALGSFILALFVNATVASSFLTALMEPVLAPKTVQKNKFTKCFYTDY